MLLKRLIAVALLCVNVGAARPPRRPAAEGDSFGFPRGARSAQTIQSIEFNGITVLHEDLIHSMSPVQEKIDVAKQGINVNIRFQFDEMVIHPNGKPENAARISIVHNETEAEILSVPMRSGQSALRGVLRFDAKARHSARTECTNTTYMVHIIVPNRMFGRASVIELGKLKFTKKSNGKTGIKLHTYPCLRETRASTGSWDPLGWTWTIAFHFFLALGAALLLIVAIEAKRTYGMFKLEEDSAAASKRWLHLTLTCVVLYLGMSISRALEWVTMSEIVYAAPSAAVVAVVSFCLAGSPEEELQHGDNEELDDDDGEDEAECKKTN